MNQGTKQRQLVLDTATGRVGEVMDRTNIGRYERVWLRPVGGGVEWETGADDTRPAGDEREQAA